MERKPGGLRGTICRDNGGVACLSQAACTRCPCSGRRSSVLASPLHPSAQRFGLDRLLLHRAHHLRTQTPAGVLPETCRAALCTAAAQHVLPLPNTCWSAAVRQRTSCLRCVLRFPLYTLPRRPPTPPRLCGTYIRGGECGKRAGRRGWCVLAAPAAPAAHAGTARSLRLTILPPPRAAPRNRSHVWQVGSSWGGTAAGHCSATSRDDRTACASRQRHVAACHTSAVAPRRQRRCGVAHPTAALRTDPRRPRPHRRSRAYPL